MSKRDELTYSGLALPSWLRTKVTKLAEKDSNRSFNAMVGILLQEAVKVRESSSKFSKGHNKCKH